MGEHGNVGIANRAWDALVATDLDAFAEVFSHDVAWNTSGRGRWAGKKKGRDAIVDHLSRLGAAADGFTWHKRDVMASDDHAVVLCSVAVRRGEITQNFDVAVVFGIEAGQVRTVHPVPYNQYALDAVWE